MVMRTALPTYDFAGLVARPGDIVGRVSRGSILGIGHRALMGFDGAIAHSAGPGDYFRIGSIREILDDTELVSIIHPTRSLEETYARFARANQLIGTSWWDMNCIQTTDYIAGIS